MVKVMATAAEQEKQKKAKEYEKYVKQVTPTHSLFKTCAVPFSAAARSVYWGRES